MKPSIITISRQYGSGGRQVGTELSKLLNIPFYDKALCEEAAKASGIHPDFFEQAENKSNRFLNNVFIGGGNPLHMSLDDRMFLAQVETIRNIANKGPCIIVGRGANKILSNRDDVLNVFIYANRKVRLKRIEEEYHVPHNQAESMLNITDKNRASYLKAYTDQTFGKAENYHLCIDSGAIGIEKTVQLIAQIYNQNA